MRRKGAKTGGGAPGWMTTFADLMALMLTFFVLLLSMSTTDAKRYEQALISIQEAFGKPMHGYMTGTGKIIGEGMQIPTPATSDSYEPELEPMVEPPAPSPEVIDATTKLYNDLQQELAEEIDNQDIEVEQLEDKVMIRFQEQISFDLASARLRENFIPILNRVSQTLSGTEGSILVVGHTDDLPITTARFRSNWDLSAARAASVVHHILEQTALPPKRIIASGRADSMPLVPNTTAQTRARNRRVEIVVTMGNIADATEGLPGTGDTPMPEADEPAPTPLPERSLDEALSEALTQPQ
ncbi:MAG: flagellar motor protein MotB [Pseudomonadota bacterium]